MQRDTDTEAEIALKYAAIEGHLDERGRRHWAAAEARSLGYGGASLVSSATGISRVTISKGRAELKRKVKLKGRIRCAGAGRPKLTESQPGLSDALENLVDPLTRGDPTSPLRWTCKSKAKLASALIADGWKVSPTMVGRLLRLKGYSLQSVRKSREGASHPDRNAQFENINEQAKRFMAKNQPVISVDTKKKELVGDFRNSGREWHPKGTPDVSLVHDFPQDSIGKAIPYGIYDMSRNEAYVNVGVDHDTPTFAVASIRRWWSTMGQQAYPKAKEIFITADAGGSNGYRAHSWKVELQNFSNEFGLRVWVSHFPPGTSKWNKIEHRLFCHITANWRGKPLRTFEAIVQLIGHTTTPAGLRVHAKLDKRSYPKGKTVSKEDLGALSLHPDPFQGDWNYHLRPSSKL